MIKFGLDVPTTTTDPGAAAQRAEALGYDFVSTSDHPSGTTPSLENWTMLTWMAARTSRSKPSSRRCAGATSSAPASGSSSPSSTKSGRCPSSRR